MVANREATPSNTIPAAKEHSLAELEAVIERGLATFIEVGEALREIRDARLYRETHSTFEAYCRERWGWTRQHVNRQIAAAQIIPYLEPTGSIPSMERQARELAAIRDPDEQIEVWREVQRRSDQITAEEIKRVKLQRQLALQAEAAQTDPASLSPLQPLQGILSEHDQQEGSVLPRLHFSERRPDLAGFHAVASSSTSPEWYTPAEVLGAVTEVLGDIDLDPCSNSHEQPNVPATHLYTRADYGLLQPWAGRVYLNPPYGEAVRQWVDRLVQEVAAGHVSEGILLVKAATDTEWFDTLWDHATRLCFWHGRLTFSGPEAAGDCAPFPSVLAYFGPRPERFEEVFSRFGAVAECWWPRRGERGERRDLFNTESAPAEGGAR
jgi:hypothetical protein